MDYIYELKDNAIVIYETEQGRTLGDFHILKDDVGKLIQTLMDATGTPILPRFKSDVAYSVEGGFDFDEYKAKVALTMLPIMYKQAESNGRMVSSHSQQAVEAAVEIAEMLERRLRQ